MFVAVCDVVLTEAFRWISRGDARARTLEVGRDMARILDTSPTRASLAKPWRERLDALERRPAF